MSLPTWTRDAGTMKRDIDEHGYCLFKDALTPAQLAEARERLSEQAEAERKGGVVLFGDGRIGPERGPGNNQNVSFPREQGPHLSRDSLTAGHSGHCAPRARRGNPDSQPLGKHRAYWRPGAGAAPGPMVFAIGQPLRRAADEGRVNHARESWATRDTGADPDAVRRGQCLLDAGRLHHRKRCDLHRTRQSQARTPAEQGRSRGPDPGDRPGRQRLHLRRPALSWSRTPPFTGSGCRAERAHLRLPTAHVQATRELSTGVASGGV